MKKLLVAFIVFSFITLGIVACSNGSSTASTGENAGGGSGSYTVHMNAMNFVQSSITVSKGSSIVLADNTATPHIIANGSWMDGNPQAMKEMGMPGVNNVQISGSSSSQTIGPFTTPGTYHLHCTVHPGMNLTVIVQ